ncbi:hypothetical protein D3C87_716020 [compost metagenome]
MLKVTVKVPLAGPVSSPFDPGVTVATETSLSLTVTVAELVAMVTNPPVTLLKIPSKVSAGSTRLSLLMATLNVKVAPAGDPAGKVRVPFVAV